MTYRDVNYLFALAEYEQALVSLDKASERATNRTDYFHMYATSVSVSYEGEKIGEFRHWDDHWWWYPEGSDENDF